MACLAQGSSTNSDISKPKKHSNDEDWLMMDNDSIDTMDYDLLEVFGDGSENRVRGALTLKQYLK